MDNINFKKVLGDEELFDQQANYEENFEKINQLVVPKITALESGKVDKVAGKGLSTHDFDNTYKAKIDTDIPAQLNEKALKTEVGSLANLLTTAKTSIVNAINELFNNKANKVQEPWITPTLLNGATGTVQYRKNQLGRVEFKGYVTAASPFVDAFVLPVGYRFSETQNVLLTSGESSDLGYIRIYSIGNFRPYLAIKYNLNGLSYIGN